jgi:CDP-diglyceride synthetase
MSLTVIHGNLANAALIYFAILAVWGLIRFARRQGLGSNYWGALVIAELLILAQGSLGAYLWYSGLRPARGIHILYGLVSALTIPAVYIYTKGREERREILIYAVVALVTVGLILRATTTAG